MATADLTAQRLRDVLHYCPDSGRWTWLVDIPGAVRTGQPAGCKSRGYIIIGVDASLYFAHRLAWLYMTGEWPKAHVDHINGDKADNRWQNLRDVSRCINLQNRRGADSDSRTGELGVSRFGAVWKAEIRAFGQRRHLGTFPTKEQAHAAYLASKRELHPDAPLAQNAGPAPTPLGYRLGKAGLRGVRKIGKRWYAHLHTKQGQKYLGAFATAEEAHAAYLAAKRGMQ